ncbi:MAG: helix-turn-helix domain-containing protein [Desulfuromonadales bacterium]
MTDELTLAAAFRALDLPPDAQPLQVERAFRRKQALYADGALASYSLLDDAERQALLRRLEAAYQMIGAAAGSACRPSVAVEEKLPPAAELAAAPGRFLRARREAAGLSLREVADRTKISPMKLRQIEEEQYEYLPAAVYLRGFIVSYARMLGLSDFATLVTIFLERQREAAEA